MKGTLRLPALMPRPSSSRTSIVEQCHGRWAFIFPILQWSMTLRMAKGRQRPLYSGRGRTSRGIRPVQPGSRCMPSLKQDGEEAPQRDQPAHESHEDSDSRTCSKTNHVISSRWRTQHELSATDLETKRQHAFRQINCPVAPEPTAPSRTDLLRCVRCTDGYVRVHDGLLRGAVRRHPGAAGARRTRRSRHLRPREARRRRGDRVVVGGREALHVPPAAAATGGTAAEARAC